MSDPRSRVSVPDASLTPVAILLIGLTDVVWVRFLGPSRQLGTHFAKKGEPLLCWASEGTCANHKLPYRSKWYVPSIHWVEGEQVWRRTVVELTEAFEPKIRGRELRGEEWCLKRLGEAPRKWELTGVKTADCDPEKLPSAHSVEPIIARVYKATDLPRPGKSLIAPRPMAEDIAGDKPFGLVGQEQFRIVEAPPASPEEVHRILSRARGAFGAPPKTNGV